MLDREIDSNEISRWIRKLKNKLKSNKSDFLVGELLKYGGKFITAVVTSCLVVPPQWRVVLLKVV